MRLLWNLHRCSGHRHGSRLLHRNGRRVHLDLHLGDHRLGGQTEVRQCVQFRAQLCEQVLDLLHSVTCGVAGYRSDCRAGLKTAA